MNSYEKLVNATIVQAARDYRTEFKKFDHLMENEPPPDKPKEAKNPKEKKDDKKSKPKEKKDANKKSKEKEDSKPGPHEIWEEKVNGTGAELDSIERFFRSDWFKTLSDADGPAILETIKKEAES